MISNQKTRFTGRLLAAASFLFLSSQLFAGYVYEIATMEGGEATGDSSRIFVDGAKMRMEMQGQKDSEMIYDGDAEELLMIDHKRKSYVAMGKQEIAELTQQLSDAMAQMEEQLASMPPAQRQMMEGMLKGKMPQMAEKFEITVERTGETETVAGYKTERVELKVGNGDRRELWVVDWSKLEGGNEVSAAMEGMAGLFEDLMSVMSQGPMGGMFQGGQNGWFGQLKEMGGFPIKTVEYDGSGVIASETLLKSVEETAIDAASFRAPKAYKKRKMGM